MQETFSASGLQVKQFANLTEDDNAIHVDADAAADSMFGQRVVHGVYCLGWVSSMLAEWGDGTTILTGFEDVKFRNPVYLKEEVTLTVEETAEGLRFAGHASGEPKFDGLAKVILR